MTAATTAKMATPATARANSWRRDAGIRSRGLGSCDTTQASSLV